MPSLVAEARLISKGHGNGSPRQIVYSDPLHEMQMSHGSLI